MNRFAYLQKIDENGANRYYRMKEEGNVIIVEIGRNGATPVVQKKPASLWDMIYQKKIAEHYVDTADVHIPKIESKGEYAPIKDETVRTFFDAIMHYANKALKTNYQISWDEVSAEMIAKAQDIIHQLDEECDLEASKKLFLQLFAVVPRKMKEVKEHLPSDIKDVPKLLEEEQALLDTLSSQIAQKRKEESKKGDTILDSLGLSVRECTSDEERQIKKFLGESAPHFKKAFRVKNKKTDDRFYEYVRKNNIPNSEIQFLYHGSRNQNYYGLISQGPLLNPKAPITGKMFGQGIYFAPSSMKSWNYTSYRGTYWANGTSGTGIMGLYATAYGNPHDVTCSQSFTQRQLDSLGKNCVHAHAGTQLLNDEIIYYSESAMVLNYIVEFN